MVSILIYGGSGFSQKAIAQNSSLHSESVLFDIQFIISNEVFTLQKFEQEEGENTSCIFESPSALWIIRYCGEEAEEFEKPWYLILAGSFLIKGTDISMEYYLERESHIYRNIEYGSLAFTRNLSLMKVHIIDGDSQVNVGWPRKRLPFLQTLARVQERSIEQSFIENPKNNLTEQALAQLENLQKRLVTFQSKILK